MSERGAPTGHGIAVRILVVLAVVVLVGVYAAAALLTRDRWLGGLPTADRTEVVFSAQAPDGAPPSTDDLTRTRQVLQDRADDFGDADVTLDGDRITVRVAGADEAAVRGIAAPGRLYLRPVIHAIPAQSSGRSTTPGPTPTPQAISDERQLRQSTDQSIQILALQFQATRCDGHDVLAGRDDPELPLVTCAQDLKTVYLLDKAFIAGDEVTGASASFDHSMGLWIVDLKFSDAARGKWADFTAANIGTQVAFTLDTEVVSAPEIREAIPGGRTQITGDFTESQARELATTFGHGALPLNLVFESAGTSPGPPSTPSIVLRIVLVAGGVLVMLVLTGAVVYLRVASRRRPEPGAR